MRILAALAVVALAGCPKPVQIPSSAANDAAPTITLGYVVKVLPNEAPGSTQTIDHSGTVDLPTDQYTRDYLLTASADNPKGGVKTMAISINGGQATTVSQTPDATGMVQPSLSIIGTNGSGGPGPTGITIGPRANPTVTVTASNFNGQTTTITVRFDIIPGAPTIQSFKATPDYINVGQSSTLSWQVSCGLAAAGCNVAIRGDDGPGYSHQVLNLPAEGFTGSFKVTPAQTQTRYTLTVTNAGAARLATSQQIVVTLYAPSGGGLGQPFYFEMNGSSQVLPCFTIVVYASDEASAKAAAEAQNGGYTATPIDAQQFVDGCGS